MTNATQTSSTAVDELDLDVDGLLKIPEIHAAVERYLEIQREYRDAVLREIRLSPQDELPDVSYLSDDYNARLQRQRVTVRKVAAKHLC